MMMNNMRNIRQVALRSTGATAVRTITGSGPSKKASTKLGVVGTTRGLTSADEHFYGTGNQPQLAKYLHLAPCGSFWQGTPFHAAQNLSTNYLVSFALGTPSQAAAVEERMAELDIEEIHSIYDNAELPASMLGC
jgi:hypothetical protein